MSNTPITHMMDGRQYLVFAADDTLYAYALPRQAPFAVSDERAGR